MKPVKCKVYFHGRYKVHDAGEFESLRAAKKYIRECDWSGPTSVVRIKSKVN